jgi:hypothetical protein
MRQAMEAFESLHVVISIRRHADIGAAHLLLGDAVDGVVVDQAAVARIRTALRERRPCRETGVNHLIDTYPKK